MARSLTNARLVREHSKIFVRRVVTGVGTTGTVVGTLAAILQPVAGEQFTISDVLYYLGFVTGVTLGLTFLFWMVTGGRWPIVTWICAAAAFLFALLGAIGLASDPNYTEDDTGFWRVVGAVTLLGIVIGYAEMFRDTKEQHPPDDRSAAEG